MRKSYFIQDEEREWVHPSCMASDAGGHFKDCWAWVKWFYVATSTVKMFGRCSVGVFGFRLKGAGPNGYGGARAHFGRIFTFTGKTSASICVSIFIGLPLNSCWPQHLHPCGRNISSLSTGPNPFLVFPGCPGCPPVFRFGGWLSDGWASGLFSVFLRRSADGGFDDIVLSKSLLTFSSCIFLSSYTTLDFNCSIALVCSIIISTSCEGANWFNISLSSLRGDSFFIILIISLQYHLCQYPLTWILTLGL